MFQDPNDTMQSDIPPTQPIVEHSTKHLSESSTRSPKDTKPPSEPSKRASGATRGSSEAINPPSRAGKLSSSTLNDSPFTPLSMRALYYTPDGLENDTSDGVPEGEISDAISPNTKTSVVRQKGTNLVFDAGFPTPQPSPQQYLLKIATAAFCHDEIRLARLLNPPKTTPHIPLHSLCGTVISTPREDDEREEGPKFKIGDVVFGVVSYARDGGAADYAVATETELALKPDNITFAEAAALALPALTAWQALFRYAGLDPDLPGGLGEGDDEFANGTGRWLWQRQRRESVLGSRDYGYGRRKSTVTGNGGLLNHTISGNGNGHGNGNGNGSGNGHWVWQWNRGGSRTNGNGSAGGSISGNGNSSDIDNIPPAARAVNPTPSPKSVRRESLISLVSGNPSGKKTVPRAASTVDPNPKNTVRRNSLISLITGSTDAPSSRAPSTVDPAGNTDANSKPRRGSSSPRRRGSLLGSILGTNSNGNGRHKPPIIRVLITNARDNDIGRIAVQILRADSLFPIPFRPWVCVTCTQVEADIIEKDWQVDEIVIIPHLPSAEECNIEKVFRTRRWEPVDIVLDCAGGEVFRAAHAAGVVKDYGAVLTVVDGQVALQSPLVPEKDMLGERKRGIKSRFVPVNPDGPAMERIAELVEESLVRGREVTIVDLPHAVDLLASGAAGTAGSRRGGMVVVRVNSVAFT